MSVTIAFYELSAPPVPSSERQRPGFASMNTASGLKPVKMGATTCSPRAWLATRDDEASELGELLDPALVAVGKAARRANWRPLVKYTEHLTRGRLAPSLGVLGECRPRRRHRYPR